MGNEVGIEDTEYVTVGSSTTDEADDDDESAAPFPSSLALLLVEVVSGRSARSVGEGWSVVPATVDSVGLAVTTGAVE